MRRISHAVVWPADESGYVGEVSDLHVVTQGETLDEVASNLREAVELALDGENLEELGLAPNPVVVLTLELQPALA